MATMKNFLGSRLRPGSGLERGLEAFVFTAFALAFAHSVWATASGFYNLIMDEHSFRQAQTAYSAYFLLRGGPFFAYETPLLGYPFAIPFELPIYQWVSAKMSLTTGLGLEQAGRVTGRLFFYLSLFPLHSLLSHFRVARAPRFAALTVFLMSPLYLYWSRTFMIESTALFFGLAYSALFARALEKKSALFPWILAAIAGAFAGTVKVTTAFAFFIVNALLALGWLRAHRLWQPARWKEKPFLLMAFLGFGLPALATLGWIHYSDGLKALNPMADFLSSTALKSWNFGTWKQRTSGATWYMFFRKTIHDSIGHRSIWIVSLVLLFFLRKTWRWLYFACSLLFLVAPMTFTNLHIAHIYYWCANGVFLILALGCTFAGLWERAATRAGFALAFLLLFVATLGEEWRHFHRFMYPWQQEINLGPMQAGALAEKLTQADDVIYIAGADWYPPFGYYTHRRTLMDPMSRGVAARPLHEALLRTARAGYHVSLLMLCMDSNRNPVELAKAATILELEPTNLGENTICSIYRVKGIKALDAPSVENALEIPKVAHLDGSPIRD